MLLTELTVWFSRTNSREANAGSTAKRLTSQKEQDSEWTDVAKEHSQFATNQVRVSPLVNKREMLNYFAQSKNASQHFLGDD